MTDSKTSQADDASFSLYRFRWLGYGLLLFALVDTIHLLFPLSLLNPLWEFQTIGGLVERVVVPLLGFALVFYGESFQRTTVERIVIRILSWLTIVLMVIFILLLPLLVANTFRINNQNVEQINGQLNGQLGQLEQIQKQVDQSNPEQLENLSKQLQQAGVQVDPKNPEDLKKQVQERAGVLKQQLELQANAEKSRRFRALLKNAIKFNVGTIITSVLFFMLWKTTRWAR